MFEKPIPDFSWFIPLYGERPKCRRSFRRNKGHPITLSVLSTGKIVWKYNERLPQARTRTWIVMKSTDWNFDQVHEFLGLHSRGQSWLPSQVLAVCRFANGQTFLPKIRVRLLVLLLNRNNRFVQHVEHALAKARKTFFKQPKWLNDDLRIKRTNGTMYVPVKSTPSIRVNKAWSAWLVDLRVRMDRKCIVDLEVACSWN